MPKANKLQIAYVDPAKLKPSERNARTHSAEQIRQIAGSIRRYGFTNPILVDENYGIIAGHGRALAAKRMKRETVPVIVLKGLTPVQARALMLADNRIALNSAWDEDILANELSELQDEVDLPTLGFSDKELARLLEDPDEGDTSSQLGAGLEYRVVVDCESEDDQAKLLQTLEAEGRKCRPLIS